MLPPPWRTALARECPGVRLLATSREHLGVAGEAVVDVGGLELPERAGYGDEEWLRRSEAGRLFIERARMARADFVAHGDDALVVASICERLDGIPLALEMAAARVRLMSVQAIAEGLSDRFRLLTANERAGPPRQSSLLASIEWSCGLLGKGRTVPPAPLVGLRLRLYPCRRRRPSAPGTRSSVTTSLACCHRWSTSPSSKLRREQTGSGCTRPCAPTPPPPSKPRAPRPPCATVTSTISRSWPSLWSQ